MPATCWSRSSTTTTAPQLDQAQANVAAAEAAIENIEQQKRLQETLVKQAEAEIAASEADVTRYHLEAVRQQTLLSKSYAGTPQLTEQAVDNEKRAASTLALNRAKLDQQRQQLNVLDSQKAQAAAALEGQRLHAIWRRSIWATPASPLRSTAWSASAACARVSISASERR